MEIKGTITQVLSCENGTSKDGKSWKKGNYVLTSDDNRKTTTKLSVMGENRIKELDLHVGKTVHLDASAESREFNGKWYTDIFAWKIIASVEEKPLF